MSSIDDHLLALLRRVFNDPDLVVHEQTTAADVDGWDSLSHITLIADVEGEFGIKFKLRELMSIDNIGDLQRLIAAKVPPAPI